MKPWLRLSALALTIAFCSACGIITTNSLSRGHELRSSDVNRIVKGKTAEKDILQMFGPPMKVRDGAEGGKEFFYEYTRTGGVRWNLLISVGEGVVTKTLIVWLDKNGIVTDYAFKTS